ncbi:hypothetical protein BGLA2_530018 [Burkholderia gladioli]|nr:hypothetical protein BGLA2_530018 [Burkholderia gladioli]
MDRRGATVQPALAGKPGALNAGRVADAVAGRRRVSSGACALVSPAAALALPANSN